MSDFDTRVESLHQRAVNIGYYLYGSDCEFLTTLPSNYREYAMDYKEDFDNLVNERWKDLENCDDWDDTQEKWDNIIYAFLENITKEIFDKCDIWIYTKG